MPGRSRPQEPDLCGNVVIKPLLHPTRQTPLRRPSPWHNTLHSLPFRRPRIRKPVLHAAHQCPDQLNGLLSQTLLDAQILLLPVLLFGVGTGGAGPACGGLLRQGRTLVGRARCAATGCLRAVVFADGASCTAEGRGRISCRGSRGRRTRKRSLGVMTRQPRRGVHRWLVLLLGKVAYGCGRGDKRQRLTLAPPPYLLGTGGGASGKRETECG